MGEGRGNVKWYLFGGCAVILLIPIVAFLSVMVRTWVPLRSAEASQAELESRFGAPETFVPDSHGGISPDRLEAFLTVRRSMMELCPEFEALERAIEGFAEEVSEKERPTGKEMFKIGKFVVVALGDMTPLVGQFFRQRNEALLEAEMGIGEYVYLLALAYGERLREDDVKIMLFAAGESLSAETRRALRAMLVNQRERTAGAGDAGGFQTLLDHEISALAEDPGRIPWQDEPPDPIAGALAPYREKLDRLFCPEAAVMGTDLSPDRAMALALE